MSHIYVKSEKIINANPAEVYTAISDYKEKRPALLTPNFIDYKVEKGGRGDGTVVSYRLHAARRERPYRVQVKEPIKGQVITENDTNSSLVTTWSITPLEDGRSTMVRVATEWEGGRGIGGFFERLFAPLGVRNIYNQILDHLAEAVSTSGSTPSSTILTQKRESVGRNLGLFALIFGLVVAASYGISVWLRRK